jgi:hypothetical protein
MPFAPEVPVVAMAETCERSSRSSQALAAPEARAFYCRSLRALCDAGVPFLVGGAYAFERYTRIARHTKDFDIFVRRRDVTRALATLAATGCDTEMTFPHWLGKAYQGEYFVDVIFGAGNGVAVVDDVWFRNAVEETVFDVPVLLIPPEEMIWSKAFIMERERYDGADIAHVIRATGAELDWDHLLRRFGPYWRVLLGHIVMYGFIYPGERTVVPARVIADLTERLRAESISPADLPEGPLCQGTLISREQYLADVQERGYRDAREEHGRMTAADIEHWTDAIGKIE